MYQVSREGSLATEQPFSAAQLPPSGRDASAALAGTALRDAGASVDAEQGISGMSPSLQSVSHSLQNALSSLVQHSVRSQLYEGTSNLSCYVCAIA